MRIFNIPIYIALPADVERRFNDTMPERVLPFARIGLFLGFMSYPVWLLWDYKLGTPETFSVALWIRLCTMLFFVCAFSLTYLPQARRFVNLLVTVALSATVWTTYATLNLVHDGVILGNGIGFIPLVFVPVLPSVWPGIASVLISICIVNAYLLANNVPPDILFSFNFTNATLVMLSLGMVYIGVQLRRHSFLLEVSLEKATHEAEAASKAKSEFLATMSHEVRTPLNGILGIIALLRDTKIDTQQRDYIETVRYSGETLLAILNDILDFSKMEAGRFDIEPVDFSIERLVGSVTDLMRSRAQEKGLKLSALIAADVPRFIRSDVTRLRQVMLNLVGNAIKFTPSGRVTIRVSLAGGNTVHFAVEDTGIGIPEDAQKKLFQEFSQADSSVSRRFGGTGLGLAICRKIMELMQGKIGVTSKPSEGSAFWFEIPAVAASGDETEKGDAPRTGLPQLKPLRVLVAEDNKVNQKVITGLLEKCGHSVTMAADGREALDCLEVQGAHYDLVLMDMQMPLMDGLAATAELRARKSKFKGIPVIALTANAVRGDEQRCRAAGMNDYVSKPINPEALYQALARQVPQAVSAGAPVQTAAQDPALENLANIEKLMGKDYVANFIDEGLAEITRLIGEIQSGDADAMRAAAHELKGISAMFGLTGVQTLAEGIEMCCFEKRADEAKALCAQLEESNRSGASAFRESLPAAGWAH